jgi:hypothetical protein
MGIDFSIKGENDTNSELLGLVLYKSEELASIL